MLIYTFQKKNIYIKHFFAKRKKKHNKKLFYTFLSISILNFALFIKIV